MASEDSQRYITLRQASKISGYNSDYLSSLIRAGKMKGNKVGKSWVTTKVDVEDYLSRFDPAFKRVKFFESFRKITITILTLVLIALVLSGVYIFIYQNGYEGAAQQASGSSVKATTNLDLNQEPVSY